MDYTQFSSLYQIKKLSKEDINEIYELCTNNPLYYHFCPPMVSKETIKEDMVALPPSKTYEDKYYIGYFKKNELICIMDFIDKYPNNTTAFIGFFMMKKEYQHCHIGSNIIEELKSYLQSLNYDEIRLGYSSKNNQSQSFWLKNGFVPTGDINHNNTAYDVVVMKYSLKNNR